MHFAETDTIVSEEGEFENAVKFTLRSDLSPGEGSHDQVRLYAMAQEGYLITSTYVVPVGDTSNFWQLALDNNEEPAEYEELGYPLELNNVGYGEQKVYFWAKARTTIDEEPINDISVILQLHGIAEAV